MGKIKSLASKYGLFASLVFVSLLGAVSGYYQGEPAFARASVFFLVAAVLGAELFSMLSRTAPGTWDGLGASMAFFRFSVLNYISSIAILYSTDEPFPAWWWTTARVIMGICASVALYFAAREDGVAWRELSKRRRIRFFVGMLLYVIFLLGVAYLLPGAHDSR